MSFTLEGEGLLSIGADIAIASASVAGGFDGFDEGMFNRPRRDRA